MWCHVKPDWREDLSKVLVQEVMQLHDDVTWTKETKEEEHKQAKQLPAAAQTLSDVEATQTIAEEKRKQGHAAAEADALAERDRTQGGSEWEPEQSSHLLRCFPCLPEVFCVQQETVPPPKLARSKSFPTAEELRVAAAAESASAGAAEASLPLTFHFGAVGLASSGSPRKSGQRKRRCTTAVGTAAAAAAAVAAEGVRAREDDDCSGGRCAVCLEDLVPSDAQVVCGGTARHRVCGSCLPRLVRDRAARAAPSELTAREVCSGAIDVACPLADVPGAARCDCQEAFSACVLAAALARAPAHADGAGAFEALLHAQQSWAEARAKATATAEFLAAAGGGGGSGGKKPSRVRRSRSLSGGGERFAAGGDAATDTAAAAGGGAVAVASVTDRWTAQLQASRERRAAERARRRQEKHADLVAVRAGVGQAYMCRRCGFGPIQHVHCTDLMAHHGDGRSGRRVNNACQNCGWFTYHIKHWPHWDGKRLGCKARYRPLRCVRWLHTAVLYVPNKIAQKVFD